MRASNPETIYFAGSGDWTQARLITVSRSARTVPMSHRDKLKMVMQWCKCLRHSNIVLRWHSSAYKCWVGVDGVQNNHRNDKVADFQRHQRCHATSVSTEVRLRASLSFTFIHAAKPPLTLDQLTAYMWYRFLQPKRFRLYPTHFSVAWNMCVVRLSSVSLLHSCALLKPFDGRDAIWQVHLWGQMTHCIRWGHWPPGKVRFGVEPEHAIAAATWRTQRKQFRLLPN